MLAVETKMTRTYSLAAMPAETAPVGDCCEFCNDASTKLQNGDVRQAGGKGKLHPGEGEEVEEDEEDAARPHRDEEDEGREVRIRT